MHISIPVIPVGASFKGQPLLVVHILLALSQAPLSSSPTKPMS